MVSDVSSTQRFQSVDFFFTLLIGHQTQMRLRRREHTKTLPSHAHVVLLSSLTIEYDLRFICTETVLTSIHQYIEITISLHTRKLDTIQIDIGLPANHIRSMPVDMSGRIRGAVGRIFNLESGHAIAQTRRI